MLLLCDPRWECRDSALEFLTAAVRISTARPWAAALFENSGLMTLAWSCLADKESFVRSTALGLVGQCCTTASPWSALLSASGKSSQDVFDQVVRLTADTEAFVRRASLTCIESLLHHTPSTELAPVLESNAVREALVHGLDDVDGDVRLRALQLFATLSHHGDCGLAAFEAMQGEARMQSLLENEEPALRPRAHAIIMAAQGREDFGSISSGSSSSKAQQAPGGGVCVAGETKQATRHGELLSPLEFFTKRQDDLATNAMDCY